MSAAEQGKATNLTCGPQTGRRDHERVLGRDARPASRQRRQVSVAVAVEDAVFTPVGAAFHHVEDLPALWMKRVRDPDRRGHVPGVTGS